MQLVIDEDIEFDQWLRIGGFLWTLEGGVMWWLGDWLNFGERKYGETYAQAAEITGYKVQTLKNAAWVASQYESSTRVDDLSFSHHQAVASLPPKDRKELLKKADGEKWDCREMERRARARKTLKEMEKRPDLLWSENKQMAEEWLAVREQVRRFAELYPQTSAPTDSYIEEIEYILKEGAKTDFNEILLFWIREGYETIDAIVQATKKDRFVINVALDELVRIGRLRTIKQGGKTDVARGAVTTLYLINYPAEMETSEVTDKYYSQSK